jgi:hypothetical protein
VQADSGGAVIFDPGSSNGSKIDGVRMKPNIRCEHHLLLPSRAFRGVALREIQLGQIFVRQNKIHTVLSCFLLYLPPVSKTACAKSWLFTLPTLFALFFYQ